MFKLIAKWKTLGEEKAADLKIFEAYFKERLNPPISPFQGLNIENTPLRHPLTVI